MILFWSLAEAPLSGVNAGVNIETLLEQYAEFNEADGKIFTKSEREYPKTKWDFWIFSRCIDN